MGDNKKGIFYSLLAALLIGAGYLPAKSARESGNLVEVNFVWYLLQAFYFAAILFAFRLRLKPIGKIARNLKGVMLVGASSAIGSLLWFWEIGKAGAVNTAFILQFTNVFAVILGILVLREKFGRGELAGGITAVLGAFLFSWHSSDLNWALIIVLLFNSFIFAVSNLWAKIFIKDVDPVTLSAARVFIITMVFLAIMILGGYAGFPYSSGLWKYSALGAILSVLGFIFFYRSFSLIEVSKAQLGRTPEPLFTLVFSFLFLGNGPTGFQLAGGILIVLGIGLLIVSKPYIGNKVD